MGTTTQQPGKQSSDPARRQSQQQTQRDNDQTGRDDRDTDDTVRNDHVEIGDPVPERDRTVRADNRGQGETGEDEDLPDDDGIEGSGSERH